jgi:hypothetical protein
MTELEEQLARAKTLGFDEVEFARRNVVNSSAVYYAMDGAMLLFVPRGVDSVSALSAACQAYERSTTIEPENKRDRGLFAQSPGPSSAPNKEART